MATVGQSGALRRVTVHYANSPTRSTVAEVSLDDLDLDNEVLQFVLADLLPGQEGLHQSFLEGAYSNQQNHMRGAGARGPYDYSQSQEYHAESSTAAATTASGNSGTNEQIASDFEYAKQLQQEMENLSVEDDDDDISCVPSPSDSDDDHDHHDEEEEADRQDGNSGDDDPDNMTYEQRQALVESVGTEDRGLSDELISYLEPWKYKAVKASGSGFFSRKTNHEDCPICLSTFRSRETMITLPCRHHYHAACVTKWLKVNKTCPVCKYELFGPS